jgi:hypothetical protein
LSAGGVDWSNAGYAAPCSGFLVGEKGATSCVAPFVVPITVTPPGDIMETTAHFQR